MGRINISLIIRRECRVQGAVWKEKEEGRGERGGGKWEREGRESRSKREQKGGKGEMNEKEGREKGRGTEGERQEEDTPL